MDEKSSKNTDCSIAVLVLAGGQSKRLGQPKQLVPFEGESLIAKQCKLALSVTEHVYCVLGYQSKLMAKPIAKFPVNIIENEQWTLGMGSSISAGVSALERHYDGVLILLVDQWCVNNADLNQLISAFKRNGSSIIQSEFNKNVAIQKLLSVQSKETDLNSSRNQNRCIQGNDQKSNDKQCGPPIIFPQRLFKQLSELSGEQGAKPIVQKYASSTIKVWLPNAGIDLDTPEQLKEMLNF